MIDPIFILGLSILLVAVSLTAVLMVALPAFQELARAARSAEKLFDTLRRELPPTLESIRLTGMEISELTDDVSDGVRSAGQVVKRVDQSLEGAKQQAQKAQTTTRSLVAGMKAAWKTWTRKPTTTSNRRSSSRLSTQASGSTLPSRIDAARADWAGSEADLPRKLTDAAGPTVGYPESTNWIDEGYPSPLAVSSEGDISEAQSAGKRAIAGEEQPQARHYLDASNRRNLHPPSEGSALNGE